MVDGKPPDSVDEDDNRSVSQSKWIAYIIGGLFHALRYPKKLLNWLHNKINRVRITVLNLLVLLAVLVGTWALFIELEREQIIIQPILVPDELEDIGITGEIVARWIRDEIENVQTTASTTRRRALYVSSEDLPDITVGNSGFTFRSLVALTRHLFSDTSKQVNGEIVVRQIGSNGDAVVGNCHNSELRSQDTRFLIRLRTSFGETTYWPACGNDIEKLTEAAAHEVIRLSNPYVLASYHFELSQRSINPESAVRARELATYIIRKRPREEHKWAMNLLGLISANNNEPERAITQYAQIEQQGFRFSHAYTNWGTALMSADPPNYKAAIDKYVTAVAIDPQNSAAFFNWAIALTEINPPQYEAAIDKYRSAFEIDPKNEAALFRWGLTLFLLGKHQEAIVKYRATVTMNPTHTEAYFAWGNALVALGFSRYEEAIEKYRIATEIDPNFATAFVNQAHIWRALDQPEKAKKLYQHAECLKSQNLISTCSLSELD